MNFSTIDQNGVWTFISFPNLLITPSLNAVHPGLEQDADAALVEGLLAQLMVRGSQAIRVLLDAGGEVARELRAQVRIEGSNVFVGSECWRPKCG